MLPLLHGPYGEDGTVQGLLELAGLPYVGAGVLGSAVGMDKIMMKRAFAAPGSRSRATSRSATATTSTRSPIGGRGRARVAVLREAVEHGLVGRRVEGARRAASSTAAIARALEYDEWVLAEEMVDGREIEVAVLGDDPPEASLPGEIVPGAEFYDYADKYEDGAAKLLAPAPLDDAETATVRALAVRAFEACRCEAMARVDFFYARQRVRRERAQHDPGVHADLDVPAAVGGVGPAVLPAPRPPDRARDRAPPRRARRGGRQR